MNNTPSLSKRLRRPVVAAGIVVLCLGIGPLLRGDVEGIPELSYPRKALIKGACLEFKRMDYIHKRLAQFDLLAGACLYPDYWIEDPERWTMLEHNIREIYRRNTRIVMLGTVTFPFKVMGVDPAAPKEMWLRDMSGRAIPGWPGQFYLDYGRPETIDFIARHQTKLIKKVPLFEGVYVDQFSFSCPVPEKYKLDLDGDGSPDSRQQLDARWQAGALKLLKELRAQWGEQALIIINVNVPPPAEARPLINGVAFEGNFSTEIQADEVNEVLAQLTATKDYAKPTVNIVVQWAKPELVESCPELPWQNLYYGKRQQFLIRALDSGERFRIGMAIAQLADSFYAYEFGEKWPGQVWWFDELFAPLGQALATWEEAKPGIFVRRFQGGNVYLNTLDSNYRQSFDVQYHDMTQHEEGRWFTINPGDAKFLVRRIKSQKVYQFLKLPREELSLYYPDATHPKRPLPEGVKAISVRTSRDATRYGLQYLTDGSIDDPSVWSSDLGMAQHIEIEFTRPRPLKKLEIWPASDQLKHLIYNYEVRVWRNGDWQDIVSVQNNTEGKKIAVDINKDECLRLQFRVTKTGDNRLHVREIKWE
ncbi:putative glycoside hydrolase [Candidatus Sumerlaeota bacterium]